MDIVGWFPLFGYLWTMLLCTLVHQCSVWTHFCISLGQIPESGIAGSDGKFVFKFLKNCQTVLQTHFTSLPPMCEGNNRTPSLPVLIIACLFGYGHPSGVNGSSQFRAAFSSWWMILSILPCDSAQLYIFFGKMSVHSYPSPIFKPGYWVLRALYTFWVLVAYHLCGFQVSPIPWVAFSTFVMVFFVAQKSTLIKSNSSNFSFVTFIWGIINEKALPKFRS